MAVLSNPRDLSNKQSCPDNFWPTLPAFSPSHCPLSLFPTQKPPHTLDPLSGLFLYTGGRTAGVYILHTLYIKVHDRFLYQHHGAFFIIPGISSYHLPFFSLILTLLLNTECTWVHVYKCPRPGTTIPKLISPLPIIINYFTQETPSSWKPGKNWLWADLRRIQDGCKGQVAEIPHIFTITEFHINSGFFFCKT